MYMFHCVSEYSELTSQLELISISDCQISRRMFTTISTTTTWALWTAMEMDLTWWSPGMMWMWTPWHWMMSVSWIQVIQAMTRRLLQTSWSLEQVGFIFTNCNQVQQFPLFMMPNLNHYSATLPRLYFQLVTFCPTYPRKYSEILFNPWKMLKLWSQAMETCSMLPAQAMMFSMTSWMTTWNQQLPSSKDLQFLLYQQQLKRKEEEKERKNQ